MTHQLYRTDIERRLFAPEPARDRCGASGVAALLTRLLRLACALIAGELGD